MPAQPAPQITQPQTNAPAPAGPEARVFTMPERYRHGAQVTLHQPEKKEAPKPPIEVKTPGVPAPPSAPPRPASTKARRSSTKKIILIGVAALLVLGVGGFFLVRSAPPTVPVPSSAPARPVLTPPTVATKPPVEPPVETPDTTSEVFPVEIVPGVDTDSDGLTDTEEEQVYKTDPRRPDTDSDGFLDGNEVFHRYNPGGTAPGTLLESGLVVEVSGVADGLPFSYLHPATWKRTGIDTGWELDSGTGEGIRMTTMAKRRSQTLAEWLSAVDADARPTLGQTKNGLPLAQVDQLTAYIDLGDMVFILVYDTGVKARVDYLQTFQMMINSVVIGQDEELATPSS